MTIAPLWVQNFAKRRTLRARLVLSEVEWIDKQLVTSGTLIAVS
jgi:hypothetical protein